MPAATGLISHCVDADEIIETHAERYPKLSTLSAERVRLAVAEGRERGFAFLDAAVYPGTAAVGVAIPALAPTAAISVAAIGGLNANRCGVYLRDDKFQACPHQCMVVCDQYPHRLQACAVCSTCVPAAALCRGQ